jgi:hypothetical protein
MEAELHFSHVYGPILGPALYRACARVWGAGLAVTSARLSNTKELVQAAWPSGTASPGYLLAKKVSRFCTSIYQARRWHISSAVSLTSGKVSMK